MTEAVKKSNWMIGIISFFFILLIINICILVTAYKHRPHKIVSNAYDHGLKFEEALQRRKNFSKLGLRPTVELDCKDVCKIMIVITGSSNYQNWPDTLELDLKKTNQASQDLQITLKQSESGKYSAVLPKSISGMWFVTANFILDGQAVEFTELVKF